MPEYINRTAALWKVLDIIKKAILEIPAADVAEAKPGEWVVVEKEGFGGSDYNATPHYRCSVCGKDAFNYTESSREHGASVTSRWFIISNYCPNCGAKMDQKEGADNGKP